MWAHPQRRCTGTPSWPACLTTRTSSSAWTSRCRRCPAALPGSRRVRQSQAAPVHAAPVSPLYPATISNTLPLSCLHPAWCSLHGRPLWCASVQARRTPSWLLLQEAARQNEEKRQGESAQSVLSRMQRQREPPAAAQVTELSPAEAEKESGNAAFKQGNLQEVFCVCLALLADPPLRFPALPSGGAQGCLMIRFKRLWLLLGPHASLMRG